MTLFYQTPIDEPPDEEPRREAYQLVPDKISQDTVTALRELLVHAETGRLIGIAFVGMYRSRRYIANTAGEASRNPTFARGMIAALDDHLADMVRGAPPG